MVARTTAQVVKAKERERNGKKAAKLKKPVRKKTSLLRRRPTVPLSRSTQAKAKSVAMKSSAMKAMKSASPRRVAPVLKAGGKPASKAVGKPKARAVTVLKSADKSGQKLLVKVRISKEKVVQSSSRPAAATSIAAKSVLSSPSRQGALVALPPKSKRKKAKSVPRHMDKVQLRGLDLIEVPLEMLSPEPKATTAADRVGAADCAAAGSGSPVADAAVNAGSPVKDISVKGRSGAGSIAEKKKDEQVSPRSERPKRNCMRPLQTWRGERLVYERIAGSPGPSIRCAVLNAAMNEQQYSKFLAMEASDAAKQPLADAPPAASEQS